VPLLSNTGTVIRLGYCQCCDDYLMLKLQDSDSVTTCLVTTCLNVNLELETSFDRDHVNEN
jgi:hypothetical protein